MKKIIETIKIIIQYLKDDYNDLIDFIDKL